MVRAKGGEDGMLGAITVRNVNTGAERDLEVKGLFFGIGHDPATKFLGGQLALDEDAYVVTKPDSTATSVPGVFAAGDVQDKVWRQAVTAAGTGALLSTADTLLGGSVSVVLTNVVISSGSDCPRILTRLPCCGWCPAVCFLAGLVQD